jgi:hypothetical protein
VHYLIYLPIPNGYRYPLDRGTGKVYNPGYVYGQKLISTDYIGMGMVLIYSVYILPIVILTPLGGWHEVAGCAAIIFAGVTLSIWGKQKFYRVSSNSCWAYMGPPATINKFFSTQEVESL